MEKEIASFHAVIEIIGINPFVFVPDEILEYVFQKAGKDKGPIPISGMINEVPYQQTLVKFSGHWRLYINTKMLPRSPQRIGQEISVTIQFDASDRSIQPHPKLMKALEENSKAHEVFLSLTPSLQNEIVRYISQLKTEESIRRNVDKAIGFLLGKERFVGRDLNQK